MGPATQALGMEFNDFSFVDDSINHTISVKCLSACFYSV